MCSEKKLIESIALLFIVFKHIHKKTVRPLEQRICVICAKSQITCISQTNIHINSILCNAAVNI